MTCCISRICVMLLFVSSDMSASHRHGSVAIVASAASKPSASTHASRPLYIFDSWAAGSGILRAVLQHMVHEGSIPGMHGKDTVPQFVRMLSRRGSSCTARCSLYGCTARTCVQNHPRTHGPQCHRNSTGPSLGAPRIHAQQACTSEHWELTCHQAVLCLNMSLCLLIGGQSVLCMLFHVLLQSLHVCSKTGIHRRCDSALQLASIRLSMERCRIGRVVSAARRTAPTCRVRRNPGLTPSARLLSLPEFFWHRRPRRLCLNM